MAAGFHEGELAVQRRAGVEEASRPSGMLAEPSLDGGLGWFLHDRDFAAVTARDRGGRLWVSPLFEAPGFLDGHGRRLRIRTAIATSDPLAGLEPGQPVGLLVIDFANRRRVRVNGTLVAADHHDLEVAVDQAYGNCPKYIQQRDLDRTPTPDATRDPHGRRSAALTADQATMIELADTFFLGTSHPTRGADASHRSGTPGFVRVEDGRLWWPDYVGNNLPNSIGNLASDDAAALLFIDFDSGTTLQLIGTAALTWTSQGTPGDDGGTGRRVCFAPAAVIEAGRLPLYANPARHSPRNPQLT